MNLSYQLLLNVIMREYLNWYFFDIRPRYDDPLFSYMKSCKNKEFIRFNLSNIGKVVYVPLKYRSLTGMHLFDTNTAVRLEGKQEIITISYLDAVALIVENIYPHYNRETLSLKTENVVDKYIKGQTKSLKTIVPSKIIKKRGINDNSDKYKPVKDLFTEYSGIGCLKDLKDVLNSCISKSKLSEENTIFEWLKIYSNLLVNKTSDDFCNQGIISPALLYTTAISFDDKDMPNDMIILSDSYVNYFKHKVYIDKAKVANFIRTSVLNHHLYPLIRAIALLGFSTEKKLLEVLTDILKKTQKSYEGLDLFGVVRTRVTAFLPKLLSEETDYSLGQVHIYNSLLDKEYYSYDLIKPKPGEMVHKRYFNGGTMEIGIRGFNIETDLEILHEWVNLEYAKKFWEMDGPIEMLEEEYIKHLGVDYSHPYIGTLNGEPIFTLELYWAVKDEVGKYYPFHPGDYGFHMLIAPAKERIPNFSYYALTMCMEYFFSFKQVHRMIGEASAEHMGTHNLITKVGCEFDKALVLPYKTSNLTFLDREMYYNKVKDILKSSKTSLNL